MLFDIILVGSFAVYACVMLIAIKRTPKSEEKEIEESNPAPSVPSPKKNGDDPFDAIRKRRRK